MQRPTSVARNRLPPTLDEPLADVRAVVADDLVDDSGLFDLAGDVDEDVDTPGPRPEIPRIRPILVALAARAAGAESVDGKAQVVAELLHLALVAHDLALGRPRSLRRRVARRVIRRSVSWVAGNHLSLRAIELSRHLGQEPLGPAALEELVDTLRAFADAQALSSDLVGAVPAEEDWLEHADAHLGALFSFCCRLGGLLAGAPPDQLSALGRFGRHLGRLWHIAEDVAQLEHGDAVAHVSSRAATGRPALPLVHVLECEPSLHEVWERLADDGDPELAERVVAALRRRGLAASREAMVRESWRANQALRALPDSRYRRAMERLASGIAKVGRRSGSG